MPSLALIFAAAYFIPLIALLLKALSSRCSGFSRVATYHFGVAKVPVPFLTILLSVLPYVGIILVAGNLSRNCLIAAKGAD